MNKQELIDHVAKSAEISKSEAASAVSAVFDGVAASLSKGDKVSIAGFGNFEVRSRAARTGRNPKTGETIQIAAGKTPGFKAGKALKDAVS